MTEVTEAYGFEGRTMIDSDGDKIGKIEEIYLDAETGQPEWALVNTGLFGTKKTFVPLSDAQPDRRRTSGCPFEKAPVKDAPRIDPDGELSRDEERTLYDALRPSTTTERLRRAGSPPATGTRRRRQRPEDRRRDDALRGGAARRHDRA